MTEERKQYLMSMPAWILLMSNPEDQGELYGPVEYSFSLGVEKNRTFLFWSSKTATTNLGGTFEVDGYKEAEAAIKYWQEKRPKWHIKLYDARDAEALPVVLNWELWLDGNEHSSETFSGVKNKHEARNIRFTLKGRPTNTTKEAEPQKMVVTSYTVPAF